MKCKGRDADTELKHSSLASIFRAPCTLSRQGSNTGWWCSPTAAVHMWRRRSQSHHNRHSEVTLESLDGTLPPRPLLWRDPGFEQDAGWRCRRVEVEAEGDQRGVRIYQNRTSMSERRERKLRIPPRWFQIGRETNFCKIKKVSPKKNTCSQEGASVVWCCRQREGATGEEEGGRGGTVLVGSTLILLQGSKPDWQAGLKRQTWGMETSLIRSQTDLRSVTKYRPGTWTRFCSSENRVTLQIFCLFL